MTDRIDWLNKCADFYLEYGCWPDLPLPIDHRYRGCEMLMVSAHKGQLHFTAHYSDATVAIFRPMPVKKKKPNAKAE